MGVGRSVLFTIVGILLITSLVFADDYDFQASVRPTTISVENCQNSPAITITAQNPFWISNLDVYANGQFVCRLGNNEAKSCSYSPSGVFSAGTPTGQETNSLTVKGVGVSGSIDSGKTKTRSFNIIVYHSPSNSETAANSVISSAQNRISEAQIKINDYSSKGYDMSTAQSHLSTASSSLSQAQSNFNSCSFTTAQSLAVQAQSSADQAISQAENALQSQKTPLTGGILSDKSQSDAALIAIIVLIIIFVAIILIRRMLKKSKS